MLDILPSMPPTLVSHHQSPYYPQLPRLKEFGCGLENYSRSPKDLLESSRGRVSLHPGITRLTSPSTQLQENATRAMSTYSNRVPHAGSWQPRPSSTVSSNAPPYPTPQDSQDSHSRKNSKSEPFYNNYYYAKQYVSPTVKKEPERTDGQVTQGRSESGTDDIATHLQIPASINDSKGSLPEFAAQITCLFWFEASVTLLAVEEAKLPTPRPITPLLPESIPNTGFRKWVTTILSMTQVSPNVILLALMFIYRLKKHNPSVKGKVGSEFRLLTVALMLGNKFLDDNTYTNKTWADVSGISVQEIHVMEVEFLSNMRYSLYASKEEWDQWHVKLGRFAKYYEKASQPPSDISSQSVILPAPRLSIAPNLPSPPISQQASPPYISQISPTQPLVPHPLSMPAFVPSNATPSSTVSTPTSEIAPWSRKRSLEESTNEHPSKRAMSNVPCAASSATLAPSMMTSTMAPSGTTTPTARDYSPWRLPPPQSLNGRGTGPHSSPILPSHQVGGRAMASVFPNQSKPFQRAHLPALHPSHTQSQGTLSYADHQLSVSTPYSHASQTPSPTAFNFPHHHTPTNQSPLGYMANRNSPYKPIRAVNTLLVPPPSASVQQAPQYCSYDQMHYRPLGGTRNEQRTGQLPLHHFYTWSDNAHQMQPQLPPPLFPS